MPYSFTKQARLFICLFITTLYFGHAQNYKAVEGTIKNLKGVDHYAVVFEYSSDMQVPNFGAEITFLEKQVLKREKQLKGSGELFKKEWFENRELYFEPDFIVGFNSFRLKKKKVTAVADGSQPTYTIAVKTHLIYPGYYLVAVLEHAKIEATITIYETKNPLNVLYKSKTIHGEGQSGDTDRFRIRTAYKDLGRWISKFLHRKT